MSFDATKVDLVTLSPDSAVALLYVVADAPWTGSDAQIHSLQEKIHNYVGFVVDGQLAAQYPETTGLPWSVVVDSHVGPPDDRTSDVLDRMKDPIARYGGSLVVRS